MPWSGTSRGAWSRPARRASRSSPARAGQGGERRVAVQKAQAQGGPLAPQHPNQTDEAGEIGPGDALPGGDRERSRRQDVEGGALSAELVQHPDEAGVLRRPERIAAAEVEEVTAIGRQGRVACALKSGPP